MRPALDDTVDHFVIYRGRHTFYFSDVHAGAGGCVSVALRATVTDYRSLAVAERYSQPFGIYAYGILREFDLPDVAGAAAPRPVLLLNPVTPRGEPAGTPALNLY